LYNTFEPRAMTRMLVMKLDEYLDCLKPFLILLNFWTTDIGRVKGRTIVDSEIGLDQNLVQILRQI
jgi:hypothetical protein